MVESLSTSRDRPNGGRTHLTHEVRVLCNCDEEPCKLELYVSDIRILREGVEQRLQAVEQATAVLRAYVTV